MKKLILTVALVATVIGLSGCGNNKTINGKEYTVFGIANDTANRDPNIVYQISPGSVLAAIIFSETVIVPVYVVGWDLYEPVRAVK